MIYQKEIDNHFLIFTFAYKVYRISILIYSFKKNKPMTLN